MAVASRVTLKMSRRWRALTLVELLVLIAVIGILGVMIFPLFARARESARRATCLANMRQIALAVRLYMGENDGILFPSECRADAAAYFSSHPGGGEWCKGDGAELARRANPYLRPPVILDHYLTSRDVWMCPSAKMVMGPHFILPGSDWLGYLRAHEGDWGEGTGYCVKDNVFPPGWGGDVTDSLAQQRIPTAWPASRDPAKKVFMMGIGLNLGTEGRQTKLNNIADPGNYVICGDAGSWIDWSNVGLFAYPDICAMECGNCWGWVDWKEFEANNGPPWTPCAGAGRDQCWRRFATNDGSLLRDPGLHTRYARHLGGINLGYLDGHASWIASQKLLNLMAEHGQGYMGLYAWGPTSITRAHNGKTYDRCGFTGKEKGAVLF